MRLPRWRPALSGAMVAASTVAACETYTGRSQLQFHPSEPTRIRQIEAWIPEAMQFYRPH